MSLSPESIAAYRKWVEAGIWTEKQYEDAIHVPPPEHMGVIAAFLCSDAAAHITGCIFGAMGHRLSYWTPPVESVVFARDWEKQGRWTWEEVEKHMHTLLRQYVGPAQS